jgi:hypothetical protein
VRRSVSSGRDLYAANMALNRLKMQRDLEPIRNAVMIQEMPEEDRKLAKEIWADVDELYQKLNPPLGLPGLEKN